MSTFTLDTSGQFMRDGGGGVAQITWEALDDFTRDAIKQAFKDAFGHDSRVGLGFRHLADETLDRFLGDCERLRELLGPARGGLTGAQFWEGRQHREGFEDLFPPVTFHLADDGRLYLREGV